MLALIVRIIVLVSVLGQTVAAESQQKNRFLKHHNIYRCRHSQPSLQWQPNLATAAVQRARQCAASIPQPGELVHTTSKSSTGLVEAAVQTWYNNQQSEDNNLNAFSQIMQATSVGCGKAICGTEVRIVCRYETPSDAPTVSLTPTRDISACRLGQKETKRVESVDKVMNAFIEDETRVNDKLDSHKARTYHTSTTPQEIEGWEFVCTNCKWGGLCASENAAKPLGPEIDIHGCTLACEEMSNCVAVEWSDSSCNLYFNKMGGDKDCLQTNAALKDIEHAHVWKRAREETVHEGVAVRDPLCEDFSSHDFTHGSGLQRHLGYAMVDGACTRVVGRSTPADIDLIQTFSECEKRCEGADRVVKVANKTQPFDSKIALMQEAKELFATERVSKFDTEGSVEGIAAGVTVIIFSVTEPCARISQFHGDSDIYEFQCESSLQVVGQYTVQIDYFSTHATIADETALFNKAVADLVSVFGTNNLRDITPHTPSATCIIQAIVVQTTDPCDTINPTSAQYNVIKCTASFSNGQWVVRATTEVLVGVEVSTVVGLYENYLRSIFGVSNIFDVKEVPRNGCDDEPCGINTQCVPFGQTAAACTCLPNYTGNPNDKNGGCYPNAAPVNAKYQYAASCASGSGLAKEALLRTMLADATGSDPNDIVITRSCSSDTFRYSVSITRLNVNTAPGVQAAIASATLAAALAVESIFVQSFECGNGKYFDQQTARCRDCEVGTARQEGETLESCTSCGDLGTGGLSGQRFCGGLPDNVISVGCLYEGVCGSQPNIPNLRSDIAAVFGFSGSLEIALAEKIDIRIEFNECVNNVAPASIKFSFLTQQQRTTLRNQLRNTGSTQYRAMKALLLEVRSDQDGINQCFSYADIDQQKSDSQGWFNFDLPGGQNPSKRITFKGYANFHGSSGLMRCASFNSRVIIPGATLFSSVKQCHTVCGSSSTPQPPIPPPTPDGEDPRCVEYTQQQIELFDVYDLPAKVKTRQKSSKGWANYMGKNGPVVCKQIAVRREPLDITFFQSLGECLTVCTGAPPPDTPVTPPPGGKCTVMDFDRQDTEGTGFFRYEPTNSQSTRKIQAFVPPIFGNFKWKGGVISICAELRGRQIPTGAIFWTSANACLAECDPTAPGGPTPGPAPAGDCTPFQEALVPSSKKDLGGIRKLGYATYRSSKTGDVLNCGPVWGSQMPDGIHLYEESEIDQCLVDCGITKRSQCSVLSPTDVARFEKKQIERGGSANHPNTLQQFGFAAIVDISNGNTVCAQINGRYVPTEYRGVLFATGAACSSACSVPQKIPTTSKATTLSVVEAPKRLETTCSPLSTTYAESVNMGEGEIKPLGWAVVVDKCTLVTGKNTPQDVLLYESEEECIDTCYASEHSSVHLQVGASQGLEGIRIQHNGKDLNEKHPVIKLDPHHNHIVFTASTNTKTNLDGAGVLVSAVNLKGDTVPRVIRTQSWTCKSSNDKTQLPTTSEQAVKEALLAPNDWLPAFTKGTNQHPYQHRADVVSKTMPSSAEWLWFNQNHVVCVLDMDEIITHHAATTTAIPRKCTGNSSSSSPAPISDMIHMQQFIQHADECHNLCSNSHSCTDWHHTKSTKLCALYKISGQSPQDCQL